MSTPVAWREPASEDDIAAVIRDAYNTARRVRVLGSGHSFSPIAAPVDIALALNRWSGIEALDEGSVTVRAGTRLSDVSAALAQHGLALPIVGSITRQTVAGAIATGTHGSSLAHGNLSSLVQAVTMITGTGERLELDHDDPRLEGARVHLGALGAITTVRLTVVPAFRLAETVENVPIDEVATRLETIAHSAEYVKVWWLPHTPLAHIYRYERTTERTSSRPKPETERWLDERVLHRFILPGVFAVHRRWPATIPWWNRVLVRAFLDRPKRVGASELLLTTPNPVRHHESEAAVPLTAGGETLARVVRLIDANEIKVNFIVEVRFVRGDEAWMSPAYGGDVAQVGVYSAAATPDRQRYFAEFWRTVGDLGARPHWGKEMEHDAADILSLWPLAQRFGDLRDELDPARVFTNRFLERVLGP